MNCPICEISFTDVNETTVITGIDTTETTDTALCPKCHFGRFYDSDVKEIVYQHRKSVIIAEISKKFPEDYSSVIHDGIVDGLVRAEIQASIYEKLICNNREGNNTSVYNLLQMERSHYRALLDKLNISVKAMRKDTKGTKAKISQTFEEQMATMLEGIDEDELGEVPAITK